MKRIATAASLLALIIYIEGDNGASAEGQPNGTPNEVAMFNQINPSVEDQLKYFYDVWGTDRTYNHMSIGWAWAFDTPFSGPSRLPCILVALVRAWRFHGPMSSRTK